MTARFWLTPLILLAILGTVACGGGAAPAAPTTAPATGAKTETKSVPPAAAPTSAAPAASPAAKTAASPAAQASPAAPTGPLKEVKLGWTASVTFLPAPAAEDLGESRQEGLKVTFIDFQGGAEVTAAMLGKSIDVAATAAERPMILYEQGQKARNIMHTEAKQSYGVIVRKDLNIKPGDWNALKGKKLGMTRPGSGTDLMLRALLKYNNLDPDRDVQIIGVGGIAQTLAAIESKQIDGAISAEPSLTQAVEVQKTADMFLDFRKEGPAQVRDAAYYTLQANDEYIRQNPETVKALIRAVARTQKRLRENPSLAVPTVKRYFPTLDDPTIVKMVTAESPTFSATITEPAFKILNDIQKTTGAVKGNVPYEEVTVGPEFRELWKLSD